MSELLKDPDIKKALEALFYIAILLLECWLGKTNKTRAGSIIEFIFNMVFRKRESSKQGEFMEFGKLKAELQGGQLELSYPLVGDGALVKVSAPVAALANPMIEAFEAKVQSGEIDPIKGTDFDKDLILKGLAELKKLYA